jgi:hypothetical protein
MSKKCPYCGSYNTEADLGNHAAKAAVNVGRVAISTVAWVFGACVNKGGHAAVRAWEETDPNIKTTRCCECGKKF